MNWLFLSTSGVHGSYGKLDEVDEHRRELVADGFDEPPTITFLALQPRTVRSRYGNVIVRTKEDEATLRRLVLETLAAVAASQTGNT